MRQRSIVLAGPVSSALALDAAVLSRTATSRKSARLEGESEFKQE